MTPNLRWAATGDGGSIARPVHDLLQGLWPSSGMQLHVWLDVPLDYSSFNQGAGGLVALEESIHSMRLGPAGEHEALEQLLELIHAASGVPVVITSRHALHTCP